MSLLLSLNGNGRVVKGALIGIFLIIAASFWIQQHRVASALSTLTIEAQKHEISTRRTNELKILMDSYEQPEREVLRHELIKLMSESVQAVAERAQALEAARRIDEGRLAAERVRQWNVDAQKELKLPPGRYEIRRLPDKPVQAP